MTQIFTGYAAFSQREDKAINGVNEYFTLENPNWEEQNETNEGCWNCSGCSGCSRCSDCSDCSDCSGCSGCSRCSRCSGCSRCSRCSDCSHKIESNIAFIVPIIPNIHQLVLNTVTGPNAFDMSTWHTCDTTHCRAGWVVVLAGLPGKQLEEQTSTEFAAMQIYKASSTIRVYPTRFYETNQVAMTDIIRCAEEEKALQVIT